MNIFFSGIGGVGIGSLALVASDAGYTVLGSDPVSSLMTKQLSERGIAIFTNQDGAALRSVHENTPIDRFVYTAALPSDHPELVTARELGIPTAKRDELLRDIIDDKNLELLAVSGTHGKTTTTGMLIWTLQQLGISVSYSIGTTISFGASGAFNENSRYFVYECDEFDRNFLHFFPTLSLVTSIGYDHSDTYPSEPDYQAAFRKFIDQSNFSILWQRDSDVIGMKNPNAWCLQDNEVAQLALAGAHNRRNGTLVLKALEKLEIGESSRNRDALEHFPGTNRRFEKLGDNLYSDYGHHPTEIAATLQLAREIADEVVLVYQPHQNSRQHEIKSLYHDCFTDAKKVYWLPTYLSREDPALSILEPSELIAAVDTSVDVSSADLDDELWRQVQSHRANGALVLFMGAGSIDGWVRSKLLTS